ncbi:unnamed protein product [Caenorhabditis sp. 36 PRJEB53466]|nr:unnamed protein product [Caenorhabditis sp. 36 PRJEB53466]
MMLQPTNLRETIKNENEEFVLNGSVSSHGSTDRSSASPMNADDLNDLMEDDVNQKDDEDECLARRVSGLETNFVYIQHQLAAIMRHLHAPPCTCHNCSKIQRTVDGAKQLNEPAEMLSQLFPNASAQQLKTLLELSKMNKLPSQVVKERETNGNANANGTQESPKLGQGYSCASGGGKILAKQERLSETRKLRKTGFPPVATFYQRKASENALLPPPPTSTNTSTASPGPSSEGDRDEHIEDATPQATAPVPTAQTTVPATSTTPQAPNLFTQSMVDMLKLNAQSAAHSTGSPGFLRGRGRGRPKLIGDELDADLVDYMVSLKNADPNGGHFTASQALHLARQYILERAPGLLEEHGGHVKLKLTWAMKLVSRIGERQKEIEFGLPAGTLSNMGRNLTNLPGGNFMADVMAQNLLSQHMMMVNQLNGKTAGTQKSGAANEEEGKQNEENLNVPKQEASSSIPEIVNIKELSLPFLNNFLAELNENNSGVIDGEIASTLFAPNA